MDINYLHKLLGHPCEEILRTTAHHYGVKLRGTFTPFYSCSLAKIKQKKIVKFTDSKTTQKGERLYLDISSVKGESAGGSKFWLLIIDDFSDHCWSFFLRRKSQLSENVVQLLHQIQQQHIQVKNIRCDNAPEYFKLKKICEQQHFGINFEFTGPGSPQYNGKVERKFATLYGKVHTIMNEVKLTRDLQQALWRWFVCDHLCPQLDRP